MIAALSGTRAVAWSKKKPRLRPRFGLSMSSMLVCCSSRRLCVSAKLVSRFRSSHHCAAHSFANFGIKRTHTAQMSRRGAIPDWQSGQNRSPSQRLIMGVSSFTKPRSSGLFFCSPGSLPPSRAASNRCLNTLHLSYPTAPMTENSMRIYIDADACPVKDEVYRVAARHQLPVTVVAAGFIRVPQDPLIDRIAAGAGMDAADNWIAERAGPGDIVITADIPLASRCVKAGADVIAPNGRAFTEESIGMTLAVRNLMHDLRSAGETTRGPPPFSPRDRSAFLSALEAAIRRGAQRATAQR